jgi:hypothetical protein
MATHDEIPEREERVMRMLQQAAQTERAPATLRAEIGAIRTERASRRGRRRIVFGLPARYASGGLAGLVAVGVALVATLGGSGVVGPSIAQAAALATRGPALAAPAPDPSAPSKLLSARVGDIQFPNWEQKGGWRSSGERMDRIDKRSVTTVYYSTKGHQIAYSIVAAPTLAGLNTHGDAYATLTQHGRTVIVWEARNHTCVLSAVGIPAPRLWKLARTTGD